MTRIATAATLIALICVCTPAVADNGRVAKLQHHIAATIERLGLTDEQTEQVRPVLEESMQARQAILSNYGIGFEGGDRPAGKLKPREIMSMRREMKAVRADTQNKLEPILSDEQFAEYKLMQDERRAEMRERIQANR